QHDPYLCQRCFAWRCTASRFVAECLWRRLVAGRPCRGFHSAPKRLRLTSRDWGRGFQYRSILLRSVELGLVITNMRLCQRRVYDHLPEPGPAVAPIERASPHSRPRYELLSNESRDGPDRHTACRRTCPSLRRACRRTPDELERAWLDITGYRHSSSIPPP